MFRLSMCRFTITSITVGLFTKSLEAAPQNFTVDDQVLSPIHNITGTGLIGFNNGLGTDPKNDPAIRIGPDHSIPADICSGQTFSCAFNIYQAYNQTISGVSDLIQLNFIGTAVYIYAVGVTLGPQEYVFGVWLDGQFLGDLAFPRDIGYNLLVYSNISLPNGTHTLAIAPQSYLFLDYAIYTLDFGSGYEPPAPTAVLNGASSTSAAGSSSMTSSNTIRTTSVTSMSAQASSPSSSNSASTQISTVTVGVLVGSIMAAIFAVIAALLLFFYVRHRRRYRNTSVVDIVVDDNESIIKGEKLDLTPPCPMEAETRSPPAPPQAIASDNARVLRVANPSGSGSRPPLTNIHQEKKHKRKVRAETSSNQRTQAPIVLRPPGHDQSSSGATSSVPQQDLDPLWTSEERDQVETFAPLSTTATVADSSTIGALRGDLHRLISQIRRIGPWQVHDTDGVPPPGYNRDDARHDIP